jgi:hypothetical protein
MAIDGVVARQSIITSKLGKKLRPLQHIDVVERTRQHIDCAVAHG